MCYGNTVFSGFDSHLWAYDSKITQSTIHTTLEMSNLCGFYLWVTLTGSVLWKHVCGQTDATLTPTNYKIVRFLSLKSYNSCVFESSPSSRSCFFLMCSLELLLIRKHTLILCLSGRSHSGREIASTSQDPVHESLSVCQMWESVAIVWFDAEKDNHIQYLIWGWF